MAKYFKVNSFDSEQYSEDNFQQEQFFALIDVLKQIKDKINANQETVVKISFATKNKWEENTELLCILEIIGE